MKDLIATLDKIIYTAKDSIETLERAKKAEISAKKEMKRLESTLSFLQGPKAALPYINNATIRIKEKAPTVYLKHIRNAVRKSQEFSYPAFLQPLISIADDDNLYYFTVRGSGWNTRLIVNLAMDAVAGTIDDYANAVESTREYYKVGKGDPQTASSIWKRIYTSGKTDYIYARTITTRLQFADSPAPYWSLLNYGNKVNMSSSRGGTPYPNSPGTHFVQDIQSELSNYFTESLLASKSINDSNVAKIVSRRDKLNSLLTELQDRIFYLTQNFEKNSTGQIDAVTEQLGAEIVRSDIDIKSTGTGKGIVTTAKNIISNIISKIKGTY